MLIRLVFWLAWLIAVSVLHIFGNNIGTYAILTVSLVMPLFSGILLFAFSWFAKCVIVFDIPKEAAKDTEINGFVSVNRNKLATIFGISYTLVFENIYTGEKQTQKCRENKVQVSFTPIYCGYIKVYTEKIYTHDFLGLFTIYRKCNDAIGIIIYPDGFAMDIVFAENINAVTDNDEYSMTRAGSDISEIYGIREYIPGDPIRSIHWKLSEKTDKVMVREFGLPLAQSVLLQFVKPQGAKLHPKSWDVIAEVFYSMCVSLINKGIIPAIIWENGTGEAHNESELNDIMELIYEGIEYDGDIPLKFFDYVIAVTPNAESCANIYPFGANTNVLCHGEAFDEDNYIDRLTILELGA
jgi:hypothetical protein